ncbi:MAG TPA: shikimate dehydrogenase [Steroidobacteraceae bacterium]|nr:shikimate dehydrogenase [Steroidobacteraceae bacterium]
MPAPDRYAVIGHPIAHSRSPQIHALFARQTQQNMIYDAIDVAPEQLALRLREFFASGGRGLSVTVPHKEAVIACCASSSARVRIAGAANTIVREPAGALRADNTDGAGLVRDLTHNLGIAVDARRVLLLGAGGAARGVLAPLLELKPRELVIANRSVERALALASAFAPLGAVRGSGFAQLDGIHFDLIVNATAASLQGEIPPLPPSVLGATTICYDLFYAGNATRFTQWALEHGAAQAHMGLGMLVEQAAESFYLWRGVRPDTAPVLSALAARIRH